MRPSVVLVTFFACTWVASARAVDVQLKPKCNVEHGVVLLGDIADVYSPNAADAKRLSEMDLLPAPAPNTKRVLRLREIEDLLVVRGVNLKDLRFSGASSVAVANVPPQTAPAIKTRTPAVAPNAKELNRKAQDALLKYLLSQWPDAEDAKIEFELSAEQQHDLVSGRLYVQLQSEKAPDGNLWGWLLPQEKRP